MDTNVVQNVNLWLRRFGLKRVLRAIPAAGNSLTERGGHPALNQTSEGEPALRTTPTPCDRHHRLALPSRSVEVVSHSLALRLSRFDLRQLAFAACTAAPGRVRVGEVNETAYREVSADTMRLLLPKSTT